VGRFLATVSGLNEILSPLCLQPYVRCLVSLAVSTGMRQGLDQVPFLTGRYDSNLHVYIMF